MNSFIAMTFFSSLTEMPLSFKACVSSGVLEVEAFLTMAALLLIPCAERSQNLEGEFCKAAAFAATNADLDS